MSEIVDCIAWIVRKTFWSLGVLLKFLGLRLLDLFGLVFNILACCTLFRLPFMIAEIMSMENLWEWRFTGLAHLCIFIFDLPILMMAFFIIITVWRIKPCYIELKDNWRGWKTNNLYYTGWGLRKIIIKQFFKSCIDIFCVPTSLIILISWRSVIFVRKMKKAETDSDRRKCCFKQFFQLLLDMPLIVLTIFPICSWRLPFFIYKIRKNINDDWDELRWEGPVQFLYLLADIPCLVMFFVTLLTWRSPILIWQLKNPEQLVYKKKQQWRIRKIITLQFLYLFLDVPCLICILVILITLWRLPTLVRRSQKKWKRERSKTAFYKKEMKLREVCVYEFSMIFVDMLCCILFLVVLLTLWRAIPLIKNVKQYLQKFKKGKGKKPEDTPLSPVYKNTTNPESFAELDTENQSVKETLDAEDTEKSLESPRESDISTQVEVYEVEEEDKKPPLTWSKCMWKIRKSICIQFAMLILDLPAIPLCIFLFITGLRTTRLFSDLLGGDFYMLFAVSVYYHTLHFFIDLFFIVLFLILVVLRPIQIWINLLEDEDHKKRRELVEIMKWMPDIVQDRLKIYEKMDDVLSICLKGGSSENDCRNKLDSEQSNLMERIRNILKRLETCEIEDEYVFLVKSILFYEEQRVGKMISYLIVEHNYISRPDSKIRQQNLTRLQREKFEYDRTVSGFYEKLKNYQVDAVPLYHDKSGLSLRTRDETKRVLITTLPKGGLPILFGVLLCCIPLYRAPLLIYNLWKRWYSRFEILKETLREYALDFVTIVRMIFVLICLYRAPFMIADILDAIIEKHSWKAVRKVVKYYPGFILDDVLALVSSLLSWETPRFLFTAILFGFFMPADLFLSVSKVCSNSKCVGYLITFLLYALFMGFPFVYTLYGAENLMSYGLSWVNMVLIATFVIILLIVLLLMVVTLVRDEKKSFLLKMPDTDYVRYNWYNMHVILFEILEFFQSLALIFKLTSIPMFGGGVLTDVSKILLFSFLPFEPIFWITVAMFIIWFLTCGAPIIFENILETFSPGSCGKRPSWRLGISLLANTLFLFFLENFISFTACTYERCPSEYTLGLIPTNSNCLQATFVEDTSIQCWTTPHKSYATFGLIGLVWYCTTAIIFDTTYGDPNTPNQDIGFSPIYNTVINIIKAAMVVFATVITGKPYVTLTCLLLLNIFSILFTFIFKSFFKFYPCNVLSILVWRICTFVSSCVVIIGAFIAYTINDDKSKIPLLVMGVGVLVTFIISFVFAVKLRRISGVEKERELFRQEIQKLESRILKNKWFLKGWEERRKIWYRLIKSVRSAQKQDKTLVPQVSNPSATKYQTFGQSSTTSPPVLKSTLQPNDFDPIESNETIVTISKEDTPRQVDDVSDTTIQHEDSSPQLSEHLNPPATTSDIDLPPPPSYEAIEKNQNNDYNINHIQIDQYEILRLEKNGRNLLLILEKYIDYKGYKYAFFKQRSLWLNSVWNSNWSNLLQCLRVLNKNICGDFDRPSTLDVKLSPPALDSDLLGDDDQDDIEPPPVFVKETAEMKKAKSTELYQQAIADINTLPQHNEEWKSIFERILPTKDGIIKSWECDQSDSTCRFTLKLRYMVTGKIIEVDENDGGSKLALGATLTINKILSGSIVSGTLVLNEGILGKKGPVSMNVNSVSLLEKKKKIYISVSGKKTPLALALASSKKIIWQ